MARLTVEQAMNQACQCASVQTTNKMINLLERGLLNDEAASFHFYDTVRSAIIDSREISLDAGVRTLVGATYADQKKAFFIDGGFCAELINVSAKHEEVIKTGKNKGVAKLVSDFCRDKNIGYVYLIKGTHNGNTRYKIGKANCIKQRLQRFEVIIPFDIDLIFAIRVKEPLRVESVLHDNFKANRVAGEWFDFNNDMALIAILTMQHIASANGGFEKEWKKSKELESKLDDKAYIEYLETLLIFNEVSFDRELRKESFNGAS